MPMGEVVWTDAGSHIAGAQQVISDEMKDAVGAVLTELAETSGCDVAIIRTRDSGTNRLVLEGYTVGPDYPLGFDAQVPQEKPDTCWDGDPFRACFVRAYEGGALSSLSDAERSAFSPQERDFLARTRWRVSLPIAFARRINALANLVWMGHDAPEWLLHQNVAFAWLAVQVHLNDRLARANQPHADGAFRNAVTNLLALSYCVERENQLAALLRILCSGRALGWQRVWILAKSGANYRCETCAGGSNLDEWGRGAHFAATSLGSLVEEIAHDIVEHPRIHDGLYRRCVSDARLEVEAAHFDGSDSDAGAAWFFVPQAMRFDAAGAWKNALSKLAPQALSELEDEPVYFCPFSVGESQYLAVMAVNDSQPSNPPLIETGIILAAAGEIMFEGLAAAPTPTQPDHPGVADFAERLRELFSEVQLKPVCQQDFERSKVQRTRQHFESSAEYQSSVQARMIENYRRRS